MKKLLLVPFLALTMLNVNAKPLPFSPDPAPEYSPWQLTGQSKGKSGFKDTVTCSYVRYKMINGQPALNHKQEKKFVFDGIFCPAPAQVFK